MKNRKLFDWWYGSGGATDPTEQATDIEFTSITDTQFTVSWVNGDGSSRIVLVKASGAVDSLPVDGGSYTASSIFGSGSQLGTGNYVVYSGSGNSVTVTGLTTNITYHVRVFEANGSSYITETATNNPSSVTTARTVEQLVTAGLLSTSDYAYYDAESGITVNGSNQVTFWADKNTGLNARRLSGVSSFLPSYVTDENGLHAVRFSESSMAYAYGTAPAFSSSATDYWFCFVWRYNGDAPTNPAEEQRFLHGSANPRFIIRAPNSPSPTIPLKYAAAWLASGGTPSGSTVGTSGPVLDRLHIVEYDYKSSDLEVLINHVKVADGGAYTQIPFNGGGFIGGEAGATSLDGDIYKIIIIKGGISQAVKDEIYNYFNNVYNSSLYKKSAFTPTGKSVSFDSESVIEVGSGTLDYLAFPGFVISPDNDWMHIWYRQGSNHNNSLDGNMVYRRSKTNGASWESPVTIISASATDLYTDGRCIVTSTGRVILFYSIIVGWVSGQAKPVQTWFVYSDDGGDTFSSPVRMTTDYGSGQVGGSGNAIEVSGTLYLPCYARPALTGTREGPIYKSVDNGLTWTLHALAYNSIPLDHEEPNFAVANQIVTMLLRSDPQQKTFSIYSPVENMFVSRSSYNTSLQIDAFNSIGKNGVCSTPSGLLVSTGRDPSTSRTIIAYSADYGQTWTSSFLDARTNAYMYGQFQYHHGLNKLMAVYAVETVAGQTTQLILSTWNEI